MGFIPTPTAIELCLVMTLFGRTPRVCLRFRSLDTITSTFLEAAAQAAIDSWVGFMRPVLSDRLDLTRVEATDLTSAIGPTAAVTPTVPTTGTRTQTVADVSDAVVITYKTLNRGRSFTGRSYVPGIPVVELVDGLVKSSHVVDVLARWQDMIDSIETQEPLEHCVLSYYADGAPRSEGVLTPVISYVGNAYIGSQRRRRVGLD